jgi:hypothetical protein
VKQDKDGRRLCEYPYCKNYAESKGMRRGERRYRPWCEKHRFVKVRAKRYGESTAPANKPKTKTKIQAKPKAKTKAKTPAKRGSARGR